MLKSKKERQQRMLADSLTEKIDALDSELPDEVYKPQKDGFLDLFDEIDFGESVPEAPKRVKRQQEGFGIGAVILVAVLGVIFMGLCFGAYLLY